MGNLSPTWSRDGSQLYFLHRQLSPRREVMTVVDIIDGVPSPARLLIDPRSH